MYQNNYSSKLSKFAVMSLGICAVFISSFQQVFAGKKAITLMLVIFQIMKVYVTDHLLFL